MVPPPSADERLYADEATDSSSSSSSAEYWNRKTESKERFRSPWIRALSSAAKPSYVRLKISLRNLNFANS